MANNNNIFGDGFEAFLQQQGGASLLQQTTPPPPQPVNNNNNDGLNLGFLDFLSGQESQTSPVTPTANAQVPNLFDAVPSNAFPEGQGQGQGQGLAADPWESSSQPASTQIPQSTTPTSNPMTLTQTEPTSATPPSQPAAAQPESPQPGAQTNATATTTDTAAESAESTPEGEDAILKEISEKFGGRWKLVRTDPYDEYLKAVGIGLVNRKLAASGNLEQVIEVKDGNIHISFHSRFYNQNYIFKLNEERNNLVEKVEQSVFCSYKDGKLVVQMTPTNESFAKVQEVERFHNKIGELVMQYACGVATCRRYFEKM